MVKLTLNVGRKWMQTTVFNVNISHLTIHLTSSLKGFIVVSCSHITATWDHEKRLWLSARPREVADKEIFHANNLFSIPYLLKYSRRKLCADSTATVFDHADHLWQTACKDS